MFYIVGVTETCKRLAVCATEEQATKYVGSLANAEHGVYYIDEIRAEDGVVVLAEIEIDDLPADAELDK